MGFPATAEGEAGITSPQKGSVKLDKIISLLWKSKKDLQQHERHLCLNNWCTVGVFAVLSPGYSHSPASLVDMEVWSELDRTMRTPAVQEDSLDLKQWMKLEPRKVVSGNGHPSREWVGWANGPISLELCVWVKHILGWGYAHAQWRPEEGLTYLHTPGWPWHCPQYPQ